MMIEKKEDKSEELNKTHISIKFIHFNLKIS